MWGQGWEEALSTSAPRVDSPQHSAAALPVPHPASASAREAAEWEAALAGRQPPGRTIVAAIECGCAFIGAGRGLAGCATRRRRRAGAPPCLAAQAALESATLRRRWATAFVRSYVAARQGLLTVCVPPNSRHP